MSTRVSQVTPEIARHSPRNGLRLTPCSPWRSGFLVTIAPEKLASQELDASVEASGPHDFAVRKKSALVFGAACVHRILSRVRDDLEPPLQRDRTVADMKVICANTEAEYFCARGWTGFC
ncbi:MAG TPA: hypothetical protein VNR65_17825 [Geobacterales bacterium]|nr:hypothetical protein [Geobacterales bacterium]